MNKLKQIVQDKDRLKDPNWSNLYNTDIRNLFPKFQLVKIEKSKIKYDKFRLIMQNIEEFIYLQKHRKSAKAISSQIDNIKQQLEQLQKNNKQVKSYKVNIIQDRDSCQTLTTQLQKYENEQVNKKGHKNQLLSFSIKNNQKWLQYYKNNCPKQQQVKQQKKFNDKVQLSLTVEIPSAYQKLNQSTCGLILLQRLKKKEIQKNILAKWKQNQQQTLETSISIKQFDKQWRIQTKDINLKQYV